MANDGLESPRSNEAPHTPSLARALGPGAALAVVVGNVIGSGIFAKPGHIAAASGDFGLIISAWIVGGLICLLGALCFAELAVMMPRAGGLYDYLREAFGRPVAFLFGWNEVLFNRPGSIGALAVIFVGSMSQALDLPLGTLTRAILAIVLIASMTWVNVIGVVWGGRVQSATTLVKAGFLGVVALLPLLVLPWAGSGYEWSKYTSTIEPPAGTTLLTRFGVVLLAVLWAYNGWHGVTQVAEEVRDPQRNIPWALLGGVGLLILLYVSANLAYHGVLSMSDLAAAKDHAAEKMVQSLLGRPGAAMMSAVIMCSTFGGINSNLLLGPRVAYAMGRDGVVFHSLGRVHARFRTPVVAIVVEALMSVILVIASGILVEFVSGFEDRTIFAMLTDFVIFAASLFYVLGVAAVIVLRRKHPDWNRPYRTWGYPVVPLIFLAFYAWFLFEVYRGKPFEANAGLVLIGLGIPAYYSWQAYSRLHRGATTPMDKVGF
jgi:APA family basic amino acid/polyamine antiporter